MQLINLKKSYQICWQWTVKSLKINYLCIHTHRDAHKSMYMDTQTHTYMYDIYTCICYVYESILQFNPYVGKLIILLKILNEIILIIYEWLDLKKGAWIS